MAKLVTPEGKSSMINPANGKSFTLKELYKLLDCQVVQRVQLPDNRYMYLDEEGKIHRPVPPENSLGTKLLVLAGGSHGDYVVGKILLMTADEAGDNDEDGED